MTGSDRAARSRGAATPATGSPFVREWVFRHSLVRDAAYQLQLPSERAGGHALALASFEALCGGRPPEPELFELEPRPMTPRASDPFAHDLVEHARLAPDGAGAGTQRLYLLRSAAYAEKLLRSSEAEKLWRRFAEVEAGIRRGESLRRAALNANRSGRWKVAKPLLEKALRIFRNRGDGRLEGRALGDYAAVERAAGRTKEAGRAFRRALVLVRGAGDWRAAGSRLNGSGVLSREFGLLGRARRELAGAMRVFRRAGDRRSESVARVGLADLYQTAGRLREAEQACDRALAIAREIGHRRGAGVALGTRAVLRSAAGRYRQAERDHREALGIRREVGNRRFEGVELLNLAWIHARTGRRSEAEACLVRAAAALRDAGSRRLDGEALGDLAQLHRERGELRSAAREFASAVRLHGRTGNVERLGLDLCGMAAVELRLGRVRRARASWLRGRSHLRRAGRSVRIADAASELRRECAATIAPAVSLSVVGSRPAGRSRSRRTRPLPAGVPTTREPA